MVCPDFIQYNNCHSTKCNLPHDNLSITDGNGSDRKRKRSSVSGGVQSVSIGKKIIKKRAQTGAISGNNLVIQPKLVHDATESLDFIPISSPPVSPSSPFSNHSNCSNDCDLSILPRFLADMITNDDYDTESE